MLDPQYEAALLVLQLNQQASMLYLVIQPAAKGSCKAIQATNHLQRSGRVNRSARLKKIGQISQFARIAR
jgi:hypothetical protein